MKNVLILGLIIAGSASASSVCKMKHDTRSAKSEILLYCSGKEVKVVASREGVSTKKKTVERHMDLKLTEIERLVKEGYTVVSESLFVKY